MSSVWSYFRTGLLSAVWFVCSLVWSTCLVQYHVWVGLPSAFWFGLIYCMVWFDLVWFGLIYCVVWFDLVWFGLIYCVVWFDLVWFGLIYCVV